MAPKEKKKKKTKAEQEEEQRLRDEEARRQEEERLAREREEAAQREEEERQFQARRQQHLDAESQRLAAEREAEEPLWMEHRSAQAKAAAQRQEAANWKRYLACRPLPDPRDARQMNDYFLEADASSCTEPDAALQSCERNTALAEECHILRLEAALQADANAKVYSPYIDRLHAITNEAVDHMTAHVLQHADVHAASSGEIQLVSSSASFKWALWVNTTRNPRLKSIDMPDIGVALDIPKMLALASIAIRVQQRAFDEFAGKCANGYMAVGGTFAVELCALPPGGKPVQSWTLRQVTPLASKVQRLPYPIPPAGADPTSWVSDEEAPSVGISLALPPDIMMLSAEPQVGYWDAPNSCWCTDGISDVAFDPATSRLTFHTKVLGHLAVVTPRTQLMPYKAWTLRPVGGRGAAHAGLTLDVGLGAGLEIEVGPGQARLVAPQAPALRALLGVPLRPAVLLHRLSGHGLHLLPCNEDALVAELACKEGETERAMCADVALVSGAFLISSSKWNRQIPPSECICRISEVLDWEGQGRTEPTHCQRIFTKEKEEGPRRVLPVMHRGTKGAAFCEALDKREAWPVLPEYGMPEYEGSVVGEIHASFLSLLAGSDTAQGPNVRARFSATAETLQLVKDSNAVTMQTLAELLQAVRLFSFS
ncbi:hypothetical protein WJX72_000473 [[Myrmecia] bisecta]|uniref:IC97/Casc1 N-terminal domain-containing protein n=1 Tax=[Myrmecia] bisecta TaxID=41462 RepID=A0AAW1R5G0_9CHLO